MLTRLKVSGFKNLVDVDVRFGPFTCIAGANGVGKANLFDAIRLLSALADRPLMEAARSVRDDEGRTTNIKSLFLRHGSEHLKKITFEAEMIIPAGGEDDLGQKAKATATFLVYSLTLSLHDESSSAYPESLRIQREKLTHIQKGDAHKHLLFEHSPRKWRESAMTKGRRRAVPFISTKGGEIQLHQDGGSRGKPFTVRAADLPRTLLSSTNALESPTALLARKEMMSWRLLQLEPSALRKPDEFSAPTSLGADGSHLAATLWRLALDEGIAQLGGTAPNLKDAAVCA